MGQSNGIPDERLSDAARSVVTLLDQMELGPVLIGGCALAARGVSQATSDIDLLVECDQLKLREIAKRVAVLGYQIDLLSERALRDGESAELRFFREGIQFDLIPTTHTREKLVYARATMEHWFGTSMRIACLVDVIIEKLRTGRASDLEQVAPIIRAKLSDCQRHEALRDCHDLGLMTTTPRSVGSKLFGVHDVNTDRDSLRASVSPAGVVIAGGFAASAQPKSVGDVFFGCVKTVWWAPEGSRE